MSIDQQTLNTVVAQAMTSLAPLLTTTIRGCAVSSRSDYIEILISNQFDEERPLHISTQSGEITVRFSNSHYHIASYGSGRTEFELVEDLVIGVVSIVSGMSLAYTSYAGANINGGGFLDAAPSKAELYGSWWSDTDRFHIQGWNPSQDEQIHPEKKAEQDAEIQRKE